MGHWDIIPCSYITNSPFLKDKSLEIFLLQKLCINAFLVIQNELFHTRLCNTVQVRNKIQIPHTLSEETNIQFMAKLEDKQQLISLVHKQLQIIIKSVTQMTLSLSFIRFRNTSCFCYTVSLI